MSGAAARDLIASLDEPNAGRAVARVTQHAPATSRRQLGGLLAADTVSTLGSEMTAVALPWFVLVTTGSAARTGAVLAAQFAGMALLGLWGGQLATRLGARRMMLVSDLVRAALMAAIPALAWAGLFSFTVVLLVGFVVGGFFPGYSSAQRLVLAEIVGDDELRLTRSGGLMGSLNEAASFAGPALGGVLVALLGARGVLVLDAASYLVAFALVAVFVQARGAAAQPGTVAAQPGTVAAQPGTVAAQPGTVAAQPGTVAAMPVGADPDDGVWTGLRYLAGHRVWRTRVLGVGLIEVGWSALMATLPLLALDNGGAAVAGWLLAAYGAGSVVGGLLASRARRTDGRATGLAIACIAASTWVLPLPVPVWVTALAVAANGVGAGLFFPRFFAALTTGTPPALRARVLTAVTIAISAPGPVGFLGAGLLAERTGSTLSSLLLVTVSVTAGAVVLLPRFSAEPAGTSPAAPG
jgi:MFS family permease